MQCISGGFSMATQSWIHKMHLLLPLVVTLMATLRFLHPTAHFETGRRPLSETAPVASRTSTRKSTKPMRLPGNGWPNSTVPPQAQSFAAPFNVAEFNNRVTQELLQTTRSGKHSCSTCSIFATCSATSTCWLWSTTPPECSTGCQPTILRPAK